MAPWSAYGSTYDGFWKPEISAVGRYIVGPVPPSATLTSERPDDVVAPGYMQLSGTSFSAPVVAGTASALLARHPDWTPDQVKGALMASAKRIPKALPYQGGVGEINAVAALRTAAPPNPNLGLDRFVVADPAGGSIPVFDAVSWYDAAMGDISWDSISWDSISWDSISWDSVSWADVSWSDVSWADVSWADSAKEDAANEDTNVGGVPLTTDDAQAIADDPSLNLDPSLTDPQVIELAATPTTTSP
jgi:subtilisin family serine protease